MMEEIQLTGKHKTCSSSNSYLPNISVSKGSNYLKDTQQNILKNIKKMARTQGPKRQT